MADTTRFGGLVLALSGALVLAPAAGADEAFWGGWYKITFHTDQKSGTSIAATQQETPYTASYKINTDCSSGSCIASVLDGPTPKDNAAQTTTFTWTGSTWMRSNSWRWDCTLPDGTITYDPANSVTTYTPQPDGSLSGTFQTTIDSGPCQGTVAIPLTAVPSSA
ncbi:hypothetical protein [Mycobacterium sp. shizuoka-1]|uniref:hypothetical protein n=1 Tax=Mycobacterium sp. shizuoka-1 TaxID=2039281 RepID=UPI000C063E6A|nr:hypothetical protein [Mycobacterium sp. shizuoka-1]GAY13312.1 hypothetical protein MSZK_00380 [Mycobacterium sp. shizuoka-1]